VSGALISIVSLCLIFNVLSRTPTILIRHFYPASSIQHSDQNNAYVYRYFNVIGSDPEGRLGEAPRPELREHGRISGACFDAARGITPGLKVT